MKIFSVSYNADTSEKIFETREAHSCGINFSGLFVLTHTGKGSENVDIIII